jgi:hypothetical protein
LHLYIRRRDTKRDRHERRLGAVQAREIEKGPTHHDVDPKCAANRR